MTNYNEDDDLGLSDEDTENLTPNYWSYVDDTSPAIDQVLNHRLKDGAGECSDMVACGGYWLTLVLRLDRSRQARLRVLRQ